MNYRYKVETFVDQNDGGINSAELQQRINRNAAEGWRLVSVFTNELGKNSTTGGLGGIMVGTNSTIEETLLIIEQPAEVQEQGVDVVKTYPLTEINEGLPFIPREVLINDKQNGSREFSVSIIDLEKNIIGLVCDLTFNSIFGGNVKIPDIEFVGFISQKGNAVFSEWSHPSDVQSFSVNAIKRVDLSVKKWVTEDGSIHEATTLEKVAVEEVVQRIAKKVEEESKKPGHPIRINEREIKCPRCGCVQVSGRSRCFDCGIVFW